MPHHDPQQQPAWQSLEQSIAQCMLAARQRFYHRLRKLKRREKKQQPFHDGLRKLQHDIAQSIAQVASRKANVPRITFPENLPISQKRQIIADTIASHQVTIIAGETGSGKTTQIPKICLSLGRGVLGNIGHTQPRRIAARSVASRIAEELQSPLGKAVGYKIRFSDHTQTDTHIKLMTDGILLAEIQHDPLLWQYDTIIIDEAHERSLNIDFLLGYIKSILPKRPDLKLIVTSATINTQAFSAFFHDAPVIEVSGRTYPVDICYRPIPNETSMEDAIMQAVDEAGSMDATGDILVFLPGEREIRDATHALRQHQDKQHSMRHTEILPLYSRLSPTEQDKVFKPHTGRRIVLATNVAETSLTVPGIRFVIDSGLARISRYSTRLGVQQLPIEPISQASANQRAGRCGRVAAGTCFRLYSEDDFLRRPEHTDPEIKRTNLAHVILQMIHLGLGDIHKFDFMQPPEKRNIQSGYKLLQELQAVDDTRHITPVGKQLVRLPVDPRLGRMLLQAHHSRSLREVLIIVAGMSVQSPKLRPADKQQQADEKHALFTDKTSDFLSWLKLWQWYHDQRKHLSKSKLRKVCAAHFLSYLRMREWVDLHGQLLGMVRNLGLAPNTDEATPDAIHQAILAGLLGHVLKKRDDAKKGEAPFLGAKGMQVHLFPGSPLAKKPPRWLMAGTLLHTSKLFAHTLAPIDPAWLESLASHLIKRSYSEPHWSKKRAQVCAYETLTLYGLPIISRRKVHFAPIEPDTARELFIRHALVYHEFHSFGKWQKHNKRQIAEIERMQAMHRRKDLLCDEQALFDFFDAVIPAHVHSGKTFEKWRKQAEKTQPDILFLPQDVLLQSHDANISSGNLPQRMEVNGISLALHYHFDPTHHADGITVQVPVMALAQLSPEPFAWLVPALLQEKIEALIKNLPKSWRKNFVPAPQFAAACAENLAFGKGSLKLALSRELERMTGVYIPTEHWREERLPQHLRMKFRVLDNNGKTLATDTNLGILQKQYAHLARADIRHDKQSDFSTKHGITRWDFGELPQAIAQTQHGTRLNLFPALVDKQDSVSLTLLESEQAALQASRQGLRRLLMLQLHQQVDMLRKKLPHQAELALHYATIGSAESLKDDIIIQTFDTVFLQDLADLPRCESDFQRLLDQGRARVVSQGQSIATQTLDALKAFGALQKQLHASKAAALQPVRQDIQQHMQQLIYAGFVRHTPSHWLPHLPRFIEAAQIRLSRAGQHLKQDAQHTQAVAKLWQAYNQEKALREKHGESIAPLQAFRWLMEELRVSLFAPALKTSVPVSIKRLEKHWQSVKNGHHDTW